MSDFPYTWGWSKRPADRWPKHKYDNQLGPRKGQRCRVLVRGAFNSALVEFEVDGSLYVVSRNGLRKQTGV